MGMRSMPTTHRTLERVALLAATLALASGCAKGIDPPAETDTVDVAAGTINLGCTGPDGVPCDWDPADGSTVDDGAATFVCNDDVQSELLFGHVQVEAFCIDEHEVTNFQYKHCQESLGCQKPFSTNAGNGPDDAGFIRSYYSKALDAYKNYPVVGVTWAQAQDYCERHGGRLPTEAEWALAAEGAPTTPIPEFVDRNADGVLVCKKQNSVAWGPCSDDGPMPVKRAADDVSAAGVHDMLGNAAEWVADEFGYLAGCAPELDGQPIEASFTPGSDTSFPTLGDGDAVRAHQAKFLLDGRDESCIDNCESFYEGCWNDACKQFARNISLSDQQADWKREFCALRGGGVEGKAYLDDAQSDCDAKTDEDEKALCTAVVGCMDRSADDLGAPDNSTECLDKCFADYQQCNTAGGVRFDQADACVHADTRVACIDDPGRGRGAKRPRLVCRGATEMSPRSDAAPTGYTHENTPEAGRYELSERHVRRGGSFQRSYTKEHQIRLHIRRHEAKHSPNVGFRCAYDKGTSRCP